jgi:hypothetical protein
MPVRSTSKLRRITAPAQPPPGHRGHGARDGGNVIRMLIAERPQHMTGLGLGWSRDPSLK